VKEAKEVKAERQDCLRSPGSDLRLATIAKVIQVKNFRLDREPSSLIEFGNTYKV
jgi:hypothetical protein